MKPHLHPMSSSCCHVVFTASVNHYKYDMLIPIIMCVSAHFTTCMSVYARITGLSVSDTTSLFFSLKKTSDKLLDCTPSLKLLHFTCCCLLNSPLFFIWLFFCFFVFCGKNLNNSNIRVISINKNHDSNSSSTLTQSNSIKMCIIKGIVHQKMKFSHCQHSWCLQLTVNKYNYGLNPETHELCKT